MRLIVNAGVLSFFLVLTTNAWGQSGFDLNKSSVFWSWSKKVQLTELAVGTNRIYFDSFGGVAWDIIVGANDRSWESGIREANDVAITAKGEIIKVLVSCYDKNGKEIDYSYSSTTAEQGIVRTVLSIYKKSRRESRAYNDNSTGPNYDLIKTVELPNDQYDRASIDIIKRQIHVVKLGFNTDESHVVYDMENEKISVAKRTQRPRSSVQPSDKMLGDTLGLRGKFVVLPNGYFLAYNIDDHKIPGADPFKGTPAVKIISPDLEQVATINVGSHFQSVLVAYVDASGVLYLGGTNSDNKSVVRKVSLF